MSNIITDMDIVREKKFKMYLGYCHILPDKLVFTKNGDINGLLPEKPSESHNSKLLKSLFGCIFLAVLSFVYFQYQAGKIDQQTFIIVLVIFPIFFIFIARAFKYEAFTFIDRNKIINIKYKKNLSVFTYSSFLVSFTDDNGKKRTVLLKMPSHNIYGRKDTENALKILTEEKLI